MEFLTIVLILLIAMAAWAIVKSPTPEAKGRYGEARVHTTFLRKLPSDLYHVAHNVILPTPYGTTQIDHIVVSRFGIFVIETKNMKGWIFGGLHQREWTQVLFHESYKFRNPLHQNRAHVNALQSILKLPDHALRSIVVFVGDSEFKNLMPDNVLAGWELVPYIRSFDTEILRESDVLGAVARIQRTRLAPTKETQQRHLLNLRTRPISEEVCPKCGDEMVLRIARNGFRKGGKFWGCTRYPKCNGIRNLT